MQSLKNAAQWGDQNNRDLAVAEWMSVQGAPEDSGALSGSVAVLHPVTLKFSANHIKLSYSFQNMIEDHTETVLPELGV